MRNCYPKMLVILDGFGQSSETCYNAIFKACKPTIDMLLKTYPHTNLLAAGKTVGLLPGYAGNSEVGHLTIGCGREVQQPVTILHNSIADSSFFTNEALVKNLVKIKLRGARLHIMGLLSDFGVHSHIDNIFAFLKAAKEQGVLKVFVHPFLDGRDSPPQSAIHYLNKLDDFMLKERIGIIGSLHGRFYAMDRDKNWDRIEKSYCVLTKKLCLKKEIVAIEKHQYQNYRTWHTCIEDFYKRGITDEFIPPTQLDPEGIVENGDGIIFANFRPDRAKQLTSSFIDPNFSYFATDVIPLSCFITPFPYSIHLKTDNMFTQSFIKNSLTEVLSSNGKTICKIAETEKYAHVTYFFNGFREDLLDNEQRILIDSLKARSYVEIPCMSAPQITQAIKKSLTESPRDFYVINYANADMVGHSGDFQATVKSIECLDIQVKELYDMVVKKMGGTIYLTSDHGNAECMFDVATNQPHTSHTSNPVPFVFIKNGLEHIFKRLELKKLSDVAPFILKDMGLKVPEEMISKVQDDI